MKYSSLIIKLITLSMLLASIFFTVNIIKMKNKFKTSPSDTVIKSGATGTIIKIIDGDEVVFKDDSGTRIIRLLGIKSFDTSINDRQTESISRFNFLYLKNKVKSKEVTLVFDHYKLDKMKRLISYVELDGNDIGLELVKQGLTLVFTKYSFSKESIYIKYTCFYIIKLHQINRS